MNTIEGKNFTRSYSRNVFLGFLQILTITSFTLYAFAENIDNGRDADALFQKARACFGTKNYIASEKLCAQVMKINPNHADTLILMGNLLVEKRDFVQAKKQFISAHKINPSQITVFNIAEMDYIARDWNNAAKGFANILLQDDANEETKSVARFKLIVIALQQNDLKSQELHQTVFKNARMQREIDFYDLLLVVHNEKPAKKDAQEKWGKLSKIHKGSETYIDSLIETYYSPDKH